MSMVRQPVGPTARWSDDPLVRKPVGPTAHWSENHWSEKVSLVRKPLVRKCHWSENPLVRKCHWSENSGNVDYHMCCQNLTPLSVENWLFNTNKVYSFPSLAYQPLAIRNSAIKQKTCPLDPPFSDQ